MPITYQENEQYLLGLSEEELGEVVSRRLQPNVQSSHQSEQSLGKARKEDDPETVFASVYAYNTSHPYSQKLKNVVDLLVEDWSAHDPQIIDRNPKPLADLIFLAWRINFKVE